MTPHLAQCFRYLSSQVFQGIQGVLCLDSGVEGPTAGLTLCTHGDEVVGLGLVEHLEHIRPERGRLLLILNNMAATAAYFAGTAHARYLERNMNRLPARLEGCYALETRRARELQPLWQKLDAGSLDIHSTSCDFPPLLVVKAGTLRRFAPSFHALPVEAMVTGIIKHFTGYPAIQFYAASAPHAILECGQHHCPNGPKLLLTAVQQWLHNIGLKTAPAEAVRAAIHSPKHYAVFQPVWLPDTGETFHYREPIAPFAKLKKGQVVAEGSNGTLFKCPDEGYAMMAPAPGKPLPTTEEFFFLASLQDTPSFNTSQPR